MKIMWPWINLRHLTTAASPSKPMDIPWMPCWICVRPAGCNMRRAASFLRASCPQYKTALHLVWAVSPARISHSGPKLLKALSAPASAGTLSTRLTWLVRLRDDKARIYSDSLRNLSQGYIIKQLCSVFFSFFLQTLLAEGICGGFSASSVALSSCSKKSFTCLSVIFC